VKASPFHHRMRSTGELKSGSPPSARPKDKKPGNLKNNSLIFPWHAYFSLKSEKFFAYP
jgi:hypothetical protein